MHKNDSLLFLPNKSISMAVNVTFIDLKSSFTCYVWKGVPKLKQSIITLDSLYTDIVMTNKSISQIANYRTLHRCLKGRKFKREQRLKSCKTKVHYHNITLMACN